MKTWKKILIGVVVAGVLIGIVVFSVNQANKGVVTVQTAKVATQDDLVSLVMFRGRRAAAVGGLSIAGAPDCRNHESSFR